MAADTFSGSGALSANWTVIAGSFNQTGGSVYGNTSAASSYAWWNADTFTDDQEAYVIISPIGGGHYIGPAVRCAEGAFTCANLDCSSGDLYISTWSGGTQTVVAGPLTAPVNGDKVTLRAVGTTLSYYFNDVLQNSYTPGGLPSSGRLGITAYNNSGTTGATDWTGTSLATPPTTTTASGPASGLNNVASTNFTFGLDQAPAGTVAITRTSDKAGTWSPSTISATPGAWSGITSTFTPSVAGTHTITITNDGGLSNPSALTYKSLVRHYPDTDLVTTGWAWDGASASAALSDASDATAATSPDINGIQGPLDMTLTPSPLPAGTHTRKFRAEWLNAAAEVQLSLMDSSNVVQGQSPWVQVIDPLSEYSATIISTGAATRLRVHTRTPVRYAIEFPSNLSGGDTSAPLVAMQFDDPQSNGLPIWGASNNGVTVVWKVRMKQQTGYYAMFWWSRADGTFDPSEGYWGFHPYPSTGNNSGTTHYWEVAIDAGDYLDYLGRQLGTASPKTVVKGTTFTQAIRVTRGGASSKTLRSYNELPSVANADVVEVTITSASYGETSPTTPKITIGDSPWYAGYQHERFSGILDSIKIFNNVLSEADMLDEAADFSQVVTGAGAASIWWGKDGFTSLVDLTCSYGTGRQFYWADVSNMGTLVARL